MKALLRALRDSGRREKFDHIFACSLTTVSVRVKVLLQSPKSSPQGRRVRITSGLPEKPPRSAPYAFASSGKSRIGPRIRWRCACFRATDRIEDQLHPARDAQFVVDPKQVVPHGVFAQLEFIWLNCARLAANCTSGPRSDLDYRKLLIRTMSLEELPRATTSCLPSVDQSKE